MKHKESSVSSDSQWITEIALVTGRQGTFRSMLLFLPREPRVPAATSDAAARSHCETPDVVLIAQGGHPGWWADALLKASAALGES